MQNTNGLRGSEGTACRGEQTIPVMMTNVPLTAEGHEHYFNYHSNGETDAFRFLKNVRFCPAGWSWGWRPFRIYGELVSSDAFKSAVEAEVNSNPALDHVLYYIHGVNEHPKQSFTSFF